MKKLYIGTVEIPMVVWAKNEKEAIKIMRESAGEEITNGCVCDNAIEVETLDDISHGWSEDCIPYGGKGDISIATYFKKMKEK